MIIFTTKQKKKSTYKRSLWKEEAQFEILYKPPSRTIQEHPFCRKNMQGYKTRNSGYAHKQGFRPWGSVCFIVALWPIFRQRGKKMPDSISAVRTVGPYLQRVSWSILRVPFQVRCNMHGASFGGRTVTLGFLLMRFGRWFLHVHTTSFPIGNAVWFPLSLPAAAVVLCGLIRF